MEVNYKSPCNMNSVNRFVLIRFKAFELDPQTGHFYCFAWAQVVHELSHTMSGMVDKFTYETLNNTDSLC